MPDNKSTGKSNSGSANNVSGSRRSNRGNNGGSIEHSAVHKPVPGRGGKNK